VLGVFLMRRRAKTTANGQRWQGLHHMLGLDTEEGRKKWDDKLSMMVGAVASFLIIVTVLGAVAMIYRIMQHPSPNANESVLGEIFASRMMLAATRMAILFVGLYVVLSVLIHMRRGQWLTAAGPIKVQEAVKRVTRAANLRDTQVELVLRDRQRWRRRAVELSDEVRRLEQTLAKAQEQLRKQDDDANRAK